MGNRGSGVRLVNRVWSKVAGGGVWVGAAPALSAFLSPWIRPLLAGAFCGGDGSVGVPPRRWCGDGAVFVKWGFRPRAVSSTWCRLLQRRRGALRYVGGICRRSCSISGVRSVVDGGSGGWSSSTLLKKDGGAQFQQVRGVSPAAFVHRSLSRRPRARRVSPLVHQRLLGWSLGVWFVGLAAPLLMFLCSSSDRSVVGACVGSVMFLCFL